MILINQKPSDILAKLEQGKSIFCKFGELYQLKVNVRNIKRADFVEMYFRSYGNAYYNSDLKAHPQSLEDFLTLELREYYPELFVYSQINNTGTEVQFDVIKNSATQLPIGIETKTVDLCSVVNVLGQVVPGSMSELFYTSTSAFDGTASTINQTVLFQNQNDKKQNGIWKVIKKQDTYTIGKNYLVDDYFINGLNVYVVTADFTATDFLTDAPNYSVLNSFQQNFAYAVNDKVYFEKPLGEMAVYNCTTAHTSLTFFDTTKFFGPVALNTYDWLQRDVLTNKIFKSQYVTILSGVAQIGLNYQFDVPVTQDYLIFGGNVADEITFYLSPVLLANVAQIVVDQTTLIALTEQVKGLYASKWFPQRWLSN